MAAEDAQKAAEEAVALGDDRLAAFAEKASPEQVSQCKMDNECAQEIGGLNGGAQPISADAQALVQCVSSNMAQNRLQLRSKQSVGSSVEHFNTIGKILTNKCTKEVVGKDGKTKEEVVRC